ncbi:allatotropins-like isoform X1 [Bicyclus anynana]|uniref:Allatotropins-like isoform X1 n=1 Tax=Bicyclus anynana TaxID=110368 RepID=A0ABM3LRP1_BICAN|nr:allatotropins-like isoform X1 [Bicyclus anynana]
MNTTVYLALVVAACLCSTEGAPEVRLTRKQQRPTRGFKNLEMMTARGFGKRAELYGMDNFWENLEAAQEKDGQDADQKTLQSIPLDWFVNEMVNNPDFARSVVRKFIDLNQDGMLSSEELLRNV